MDERRLRAPDFPTFAQHISLLGAALLHDPEDQP